MDSAEKLKVLSRIGRRLSDSGVTWAVGGSLMLYFRHIVGEFADIDIMTTEEDAPRVRDILLSLGAPDPPRSNSGYKTRHFMEFSVDGVDVDAIAGLVITRGGVDYECPFGPANIDGRAEADGVPIPLQSLADWREYYQLMGRAEKAEMIDRLTHRPGRAENL